jgi:hypothetical protein
LLALFSFTTFALAIFMFNLKLTVLCGFFYTALSLQVCAAPLMTLVTASKATSSIASDWFGSHEFLPGSETGFGLISGNGQVFNHYWQFSLAAPAQFGSVNFSANYLTNISGTTVTTQLSDGMGALYRDNGPTGADPSDSLVQSGVAFNSVGGPQSVGQSFSSLSGGNYYYKVSGIASAGNANYIINSTMQVSAVPEPEQVLLLLSGLSITIVAARRKKSQS